MINNYMAIIFLAEKLDNIRALTKMRPLASVPVGGTYRIIDFALSNLVNAGIRNVGIFAGNEDLNSLTDHIGRGTEWDLDRNKDGIFMFNQMADSTYTTNMKRVKKNMEYFFRSKQNNVVVLSSHMVCNLDVNDVIKVHEASGKDITLVYKKVKQANERFDNCNSVKLGRNGEVLGIGQNLFFKRDENISLEAFVLSKELLIKMICDGIQEGAYYTVRDLLTRNIGRVSINGYEFKGYLACINSTKEYFNFNMDLLKKEVRDDLFNKDRSIYTKSKNTPPSLFRDTAQVSNTLIANGCIIGGVVKNSILARGAVVEEGAVVEDCILLQDSVVKSGAILKNIIVDKNNVVKSNEKLSASRNYPLVIEKSIQWDDKHYKNIFDFLERTTLNIEK